MKTHFFKWSRILIPSMLVIGPALRAQSTSSSNDSDDDVVRLDPFTVSGSDDEGYAAKTTTSGLGFSVDTENLPIPITVLTSKFFEDSGSIKVEDAVRYASGAGLAGRSMKNESFTIRGFGTGNVLRDGEKLNNPTDAATIDRVEFLKGPSSLIYGTADPAGLVNIVTKKPSFQAHTRLETSWDEYGSARGVLDYNTPLNLNNKNWRAASRTIVSLNSEKWSRPNEYRDRVLVNPAFHVEYGRDTKLDLSLHYTQEDGRLNRIQAPWIRQPGSVTAATGLVFAGIVPVDRNFTYVTTNDDWDLESKGFDARWTQAVNDNLNFQVSWVESYTDRMQYFNLGNGARPLSASGDYFTTGGFQMIVEPATVEHRSLTAKMLYNFDTGSAKHVLTVGVRDFRDLEYEWAFFDKNLTTDPGTRLIATADGGIPGIKFAGARQSVFNVTDANAMIINGTTGNTNPNPVFTRSFYATDFITMMDEKLHLLIGGAYIQLRDQDTSAFAPQLGITYELTPGWNVYGMYSKSFQPNGLKNTLNAALGFHDPEEGNGKEIGLKFNTEDGKLTGSMALFDIRRQNIVQFLGGGNFTDNNSIPSGEQLSKGFELDFIYQPVPNLTLMAAYAYTDAYVSKQEISQTPDYNGDGISDAVGLPKENVAKNDIRLWSSYDVADGSLKGLSFGGGFTWRQGPIQQFSDHSQRLVVEPGNPTRLDLFAAYRMKFHDIDTKFQVNWQNVTNALYLDRRGYFVQPSTVTLGMTFDF